MPLMFDSSKSRAILIGIGTFLKDEQLQRREHVYKDISLLRETFTDQQILGLNEKDIISLVDSEGNTMIKERIAEIADTTQDTLIFFYSGYLIERRGKLILSSPHTTIQQCHINGIPLSEIVELINESQAKRAFIILDAEYRKSSTFGDDFEELSIKSIEDLKPYGPDKSFILTQLLQENSTKTIASGLADIFQKGVEKESEVLTVLDLKNHFSNTAGLEETIFLSDKSEDAPISLNKRYSITKKLRVEIDKCFQEKRFDDALPLLKEGIENYENDEDFNNLASFIETLQQAEHMYITQSYTASMERFKAAYEIRNEKVAKDGIIKSLEKIAIDQFDRKDFIASKETYQQLQQLNPENTAYVQRIEYCDTELNFANWVDQGDKAYFENKFNDAKELYSKALEHRNDPVVARRKKECENVLLRENELREEVRKELEKEFGQQIDSKLSEEIKSKESQIEEELRAKIKAELIAELQPQSKEEVTKELEDNIWKKTAVWNSIEGYQFYLSMFPEGKYINKAHQRMEQINNLMVNETIKKEKSPTESKVFVDPPKKAVIVEELGIDRALLMDLRMEPIEEVLAKIEEAKGLKGELLLWTETDRLLFDKKQETITETKPVEEPVSELDLVMDEAIREVEEETKPETSTEKIEEETSAVEEVEEVIINEVAEENPSAIEVTEVSSESFSIEEAQQLSKDALEKENNEAEIQAEIIENTFTTEDSSIETVEEEAESTNDVVDSIVNDSVEEETAAASPSVETEDIENLSEEDLWKRAEQLNNKEGYLEYINLSKTADQIAEAYYRINKIDQGEIPEVSISAIETPIPEIVEETVEEKEEESVVDSIINTTEEEVATPSISSFEDGMSEEELWSTASNINSIDSYKEYLSRTEENNFLADAYSRINTLQNGEEVVVTSETSTDSIDTTNDISSIEEDSSLIDDLTSEEITPLETSDDSENTFGSEVTSQIEDDLNLDTPLPTSFEIDEEEEVETDAEEEELWSSTCDENTLGAYFNYLNLTTKKKYWKDAKEKIKDLKNDSQAKEEDDWKRAQKIDTVEGYKTYIRKYPLGNFYAAAMMRLDKLGD
ncbi:hypothetical protein FHS70_004362 [Flammeovirga yaeyamensis]|nr:hypothetical protein [Flammeovirga yaeyamensis]NMF37170.1 hypothetical protein [Flammeovirga yaeyamensis]